MKKTLSLFLVCILIFSAMPIYAESKNPMQTPETELFEPYLLPNNIDSIPVSYTHLDVYKRQAHNLPLLCSRQMKSLVPYRQSWHIPGSACPFSYNRC